MTDNEQPRPVRLRAVSECGDCRFSQHSDSHCALDDQQRDHAGPGQPVPDWCRLRNGPVTVALSPGDPEAPQAGEEITAPDERTKAVGYLRSEAVEYEGLFVGTAADVIDKLAAAIERGEHLKPPAERKS